MIKVAINGCCGKLGKRIVAFAAQDPDIKITCALERTGHPELGQSVEGVKIIDDKSCIKQSDVVIDFTAPAVSIELLKVVSKYKKALVVGTTGLTPADIEKIKETAKTIPIVFSPNMSRGVNLLFCLIKEAAAKLKGYRIAIKEAHHIHKKDAPSGTAKRIAEIVKENSGVQVKDIKSIREGEIIGDHEICFESDLDTITLTHSAKTRDIFAKGAIDAAKWVAKQPAGLYNMQDVLGK